MIDSAEAMNRRLEDLERRTRLWPYLASVLVLLALLVGAVAAPRLKLGAAVAEVVQAREFQLVDPEGNVRGRLHFEADNGAALVFQDPKGTGQVWLTASPDGQSMLTLGDKEGRRRLVLETRDSGAPSIKLYDVKTVDRLVIAMAKSGSPSIMIQDPRTNANWQVP